MKDFRRFICSPYYNREGKYIISFFDELKKYAPQFESKGLTGEKMFAKVYKGKSFNELMLRRIISDLIKLANEFLIIKALEKKKFYSKILLLHELRERNLDQNFMREADKIRKDLNSNPFERDTEYYNNVLYLEYETDKMYVSKSMTNQESSLSQIDETVNLFVIGTKLDLFKSMISEGYISNKSGDYKMWLKREIINYVQNNAESISLHHPVIYVDYLTFMLLDELNNEKHYHDLKKILLANKEKFKPETLRYFFSQMMNYCILKHKAGVDYFKNERFEILNELEKTSLLLTKESVHIDYLNFVTISLELKQFDWAKKFIDKYRSHLNSDLREASYALALAKYYYAINQNHLALNHLKEIKYIDFYFYFFVNRMTVKIYYEQNDFEGIYSLTDSMNHFISRTKSIPKDYKISNKKFIEYILKLIKVKSAEENCYLKKQLEIETAFPEKIWIVDKLQTPQISYLKK
ncbi:MAG: hypothetical protein M3P82_00205 [Bacteroidota bacterium]|nr:hypothetical protein [Bacteroidota bacterium]